MIIYVRSANVYRNGGGEVVLCVPILALLAVNACLLGAGLFWYMPKLARRIIGEVRAAGLVRSALDDEFGPPTGAAAVQGGRHRGLHLVGATSDPPGDAGVVPGCVSRTAEGPPTRMGGGPSSCPVYRFLSTFGAMMCPFLRGYPRRIIRAVNLCLVLPPPHFRHRRPNMRNFQPPLPLQTRQSASGKNSTHARNSTGTAAYTAHSRHPS